MAANDLVFCETTCRNKVSFALQFRPRFVRVDGVERGERSMPEIEKYSAIKDSPPGHSSKQIFGISKLGRSKAWPGVFRR